jgi:cytochrome bd-I ubiquinol oxidase subunit X
MWYFSWMLGLGLALTFGVLNAIWYEVAEDRVQDEQPGGIGQPIARQRDLPAERR